MASADRLQGRRWVTSARSSTVALLPSLGAASSLARQPALWLALLAFAFYLPPAVAVIRLSADAVEYVDIGRHLVNGDGYVLAVKSYHFGGTEVVHDGLNERAPLLPLAIAALFRLGLGLSAIQVFNALLSAGCAVLVYGIGTSLFGRRIGALAGVLAASSPLVLDHLLEPMTEALSSFTALLACWLIVRNLSSSRLLPFLAVGSALGLGYLARPTGIALAGASVLGFLVATRFKRAALRPLAAMLVGLGILAVPITLYANLKNGPSLSYSGEAYHYSVFEATDIMEQSFDRDLPTPVEFVSANRNFVAAAILSNIRGYLKLLFLERNTLLLLLPAWPLVLLTICRGRYPAGIWPVLLVGCANFFAYALTWSTFDRHYQVLTLFFLLPFAVDGISRLGLGKIRLGIGPALTALHLAVAAVVLAWSPALANNYRLNIGAKEEPGRIQVYEDVRWIGNNSSWSKSFDAEVLSWINLETERSDVLAHHNPWLFTLFTERPAVRVTRNLDAKKLRRFIVSYHVDYFLLKDGDPDWRTNLEYLQSFESEGVRVASVGSYRIFDTRVLWQ